MILLFYIIVIIAAVVAPLIRLILRDENAESEKAERLKQWEADAIVRKLQGRPMLPRPSFTNSAGPM